MDPKIVGDEEAQRIPCIDSSSETHSLQNEVQSRYCIEEEGELELNPTFTLSQPSHCSYVMYIDFPSIAENYIQLFKCMFTPDKAIDDIPDKQKCNILSNNYQSTTALCTSRMPRSINVTAPLANCTSANRVKYKVTVGGPKARRILMSLDENINNASN
ncbi:hypothetical protein J6590_043083 [Homalodisca vitripennis]|nr:hypothetical protein J6590_043083 [Homalodisca vitripennis]